jgi:hypothetical protein
MRAMGQPLSAVNASPGDPVIFCTEGRLRDRHRASADGTVVAPRRLVPAHVVIGRALACCAYPTASWRRLPASGRVLLIAAYVSASYATVLTLLLLA